jgi:outer membrane protein OmpA-like peptidoglycan-associated protein/osmotically-inducible protein OsmY
LIVVLLIAAGIATGCTRKTDSGTGADATKSSDGAKGGNSAGIDSSKSTTSPKGPDAIVAEARQRIASDPNVRSKQPRWRDFTPTIEVSFHDGTIGLTGKVATDDESHAAGNDAMQVEGVQSVANYLVAIGGQRMGTQDQHKLNRADVDAAITAVHQKIRSDPRITSKIQVGFDSSTETIELRGRVASDDELTIVTNDAIVVTDLGVGGTLGVARPQETTSTAPAAWSDSDATEKPGIPLCPGLTIVTAIASDVDYESIKTIESVGPAETRVKYTSEVGSPWWREASPQAKHLMTTHRTVLNSDLESAHRYDQIFVGSVNTPATAPGTTAIGTSAAVLRQLKTRGEAELEMCGGASDVQVMDANGKRHQGSPGGCSNFYGPITLKRVGTGPVPFRVLVNGTLVDLPAVQAKGKYADNRAEFFFLDDERNPLTLAFRLGIGGMTALNPSARKSCEEAKTKPGLILTGKISCDLPDGGDVDTLRVVKITTDCAKPATASSGTAAGYAAGGGASTGASVIEKSLAETGKVDLYSIYFAFNSDAIREESETTLKEIADVMGRHRDWKLRIAGHTDGIGGDEKNLNLSKRRAATVKEALVKRYKIEGNRLSTTGYGKSQPKDTNDTLEGRSHNRRVELTKI